MTWRCAERQLQATTSATIGTASVGGAGAKDIAIAGSITVNVITNTTEAEILSLPDLVVDGGIAIAAKDESELHAVSGSVALSSGSSSAGAGASASTAVQTAVGLNVIHETTKASINDAAQVNQNVVVGGTSDQSVLVTAGNDYFARSIAGALGAAGTFAGSPSADVVHLTMDTQAYIGKSALVDAARDIVITAFASEDVFALGVAGAAGLVAGIAGSVTWQQINSDTKAYIAGEDTLNGFGGAVVNQSADNDTAVSTQDVFVTSLNVVNFTGIAGALSGGVGGGVGAGVDVGAFDNETVAYIGGVVTALDDIRVAATSDIEIFSIAVAGNLSGGVGLTGGISFYAIGSDAVRSFSADGGIGSALGDDPVGGQPKRYRTPFFPPRIAARIKPLMRCTLRSPKSE